MLDSGNNPDILVRIRALPGQVVKLGALAGDVNGLPHLGQLLTLDGSLADHPEPTVHVSQIVPSDAGRKNPHIGLLPIRAFYAKGSHPHLAGRRLLPAGRNFPFEAGRASGDIGVAGGD